MKAGLLRVREGSGSRARELAEEALALQEGLDGAQHTLSERAEENAALSTQARPSPSPRSALDRDCPLGSGNSSHGHHYKMADVPPRTLN